MKLWITGASGFLGQYVVAAALRAGHEVMAVVRPKTRVDRLSWHNHPRVTLIRADLRQRRGLEQALADAEVVIHLAAVKSGDFYTQFAGTVLATENLLSAMAALGLKQLIAVSTFSVYDFIHLRAGELLDESTPLVVDATQRDEYTQTKLIQERLVRAFEQQQQAAVTILRPGMIYGRDNLWHALIGIELTPQRWLSVGDRTILPMTYVENCAQAIVLAASQLTKTADAAGQTFNLVDDYLPTQRAYTQKLLQVTAHPPQLTPVSWAMVRFVADTARWVNRRWLAGKARLPGVLVPDKVHARFKPLRYSNAKAKQRLGWQPEYRLDEAFARSCGDTDLLAIASLAEVSTSAFEPPLPVQA